MTALSETRSIEPDDLRRVPFFADMAPAEVAALCLAGEVRTMRSGERIFDEGDPGGELHVVLDGEVSIELDVGGERPRTLAEMPSGTVFGEIGFLLACPRTARAVCRRDGRLLVLDRAGLEALQGVGRQALAGLMGTLARVLALRLSRMDRELAELSSRLVQAHPEAGALADELADRRHEAMHRWTS